MKTVDVFLHSSLSVSRRKRLDVWSQKNIIRLGYVSFLFSVLGENKPAHRINTESIMRLRGIHRIS